MKTKLKLSNVMSAILTAVILTSCVVTLKTPAPPNTDETARITATPGSGHGAGGIDNTYERPANPTEQPPAPTAPTCSEDPALAAEANPEQTQSIAETPIPEKTQNSADSNYVPLAADEAQELVTGLWDKYVDVRSWYINDGLPLDYGAEPEISIYGAVYYPVTGDILSIAELTRATEAVVTPEFARDFYSNAFDGEILLYVEAGGVLYGTAPPAIGFPEEWRFETLTVREQTEDTLTVAAEQYIWTTEEISVKEITLTKSAGVWRIHQIEE